MNREAINYVIEAEARVEQLLARAEEDIKEINNQSESELQKRSKQSEQEIDAYRGEKENEMQEFLERDKETFQRDVAETEKQYELAYEEKKNDLANRIAEEVLRRYGNSENEKANTIS
ncbi:hypothetical protein GCM10008932_01570 [Alkalibacterium iburiense]|uniref:Uncharacterized protein n=1 Tax=Alkalibacterium iburiense TaxID=290589 RepID=A0ABN0X1S6_9LACT